MTTATALSSLIHLIYLSSFIYSFYTAPCCPTAIMATSSPVAVIFSSTDKWYDWLEAIRMAAEAKDIWDYANPDEVKALIEQKPAKIELPIDHNLPTGPSKMNYQYERNTYDGKISALAKLNLKIYETVIDAYRGYVHKERHIKTLSTLSTMCLKYCCSSPGSLQRIPPVDQRPQIQ